MKIALRTSGGRGEFELAGKQGETPSSDLFGLDMEFELTPDIIIPGHAEALRVQGKPRIRLSQPNAMHAYRILSAVLLLSKPIRELSKTQGGPISTASGKFAITAIKVDVANLGSRSVRLRPTDLLLSNKDDKILRVNVVERMREVVALWRASSSETSAIAQLLQAHHDAVVNHSEDHKTIEAAAENIRSRYEGATDVLPIIANELNIDIISDFSDQINEEAPAADVASYFQEQDPISPEEATRRQVLQWRNQAVRGSSGQIFRRAVTSAYDYRCAFSGLRLPKTSATSSSGVDAAHILPWAEYDLLSVSNGLCLSKICHWAFDAGVLRLSPDRTNREYILSVPQKVKIAAHTKGFDLSYFEAMEGKLNKGWLPKATGDWPNPKYLEHLNMKMFGE